MGFSEQRVEVELVISPAAARQARHAVDRVAVGLTGDVGFRARLAAGELVANSVAHASASPRAPVRVAVARAGSGLRVEVRDGGEPFDTEVRRVSARATSGRGLALVDALVDRWGADPTDGNLVWFEIDKPAGGDRSPRRHPSTGRAEKPTAARRGEQDEVALAAAVLAEAAARVREGWCQEADALDSRGRQVEPWSEQAAAWPLLGAIVAALDHPEAAMSEVPVQALATAMAALGEHVEERSLAGWNDAPTRTQRDVIALLERARLLLRGRQTVI
jgi:anti-sigma regulatory factor (Ser/Thr protein kinase)